jgi:G:T/U-mismatch repair DNA glycosylase
MVVSEEGKVPAPDGQHTLESGEVVTVSDGVVSNVEPAKENKKEENEIEIEMEEQYDLKAVHSMVKECMAKISALENKIAEGKVEEKVEEAMSAITTQKEAFSQLLDVVDRLAKMPSDEPVEKPDLFSSMKINQEEVSERANALVESLKNLKSK